jgi:putative acetyltransferase
VIVVAVEPARQPAVIDLLEQSDEFTLALYPADSCYLLDVDELERPGVSMFVARRDGAALGIAALVQRGDGTAEVKRMFVSPEARGLGIAGDILRSLEAHAASAGIHTIQLETGPLSHAAITLYKRCGYRNIPNFGQYVGDEFSLCYEKTVSSP